jgi:hypothetical protein
LKLYRAGLAAIVVDLAVYLCGIVTISALVDHPAKQIHAGAWFFFIGSCVAILAAILTLFGYGWERFLIFAACLLSLFFWIGFTLY